jgi:hypothetical protein
MIAFLEKEAQSFASTLVLPLRTYTLNVLKEFGANIGEIPLRGVEKVNAGDAHAIVEKTPVLPHVVEIISLVDAVSKRHAEDLFTGLLQRALSDTHPVAMAEATRNHIPDADDPAGVLTKPYKSIREDVPEH